MEKLPGQRPKVIEFQAQEKAARLLEILKDAHEAERKGSEQRSLTLVFCQESSMDDLALALNQQQMSCVKLTKATQGRLQGFHLDGKRVLLCSDEQLGQVKVHRVVSYDLPDYETHLKRLQRLQDVDLPSYYAFLTPNDPLLKQLQEALVALRQPSKQPVARKRKRGKGSRGRLGTSSRGLWTETS